MLLRIYIASMLTMMYTADQCKRMYSVPGRVLNRHLIRLIEKKTFHSCVFECEQEPQCFSINYFIPSSTCHLNKGTAERHPDDFVASPDAMYIGSLVRDEPVVMENPCDKRNPPCDGFCTVTPGSLSSTCVCLHSDPAACQSDACKPHALGMESGAIGVDQLSAFTIHADSSLDNARLNSVKSWIPNTDDKQQWLQISFGSKSKIVTKIGTQGHKSNWWWTKTFKIQFKLGASAWGYYLDTTNNQQKVFPGNTMTGDDVVNNTFTPPIVANAIRIVPDTWDGRIALRLELYGCDMVS